MMCHKPDQGGASDWLCRVGNLIQPIRNFQGQNTAARWKVSQQKYNQNYKDLDQCLEDVGNNQGILTTTS